MRVTILLENQAAGPQLCPAHGLSLFMETGGRRVIFDFGPGEMLSRNARELGIDLALTDFGVLSHGHYDHGGGIREFLRLNKKAEIYAAPGAFGDYYAADGRYIGLEKALSDTGRFEPPPSGGYIRENIRLFSDVPGKELLPKGGAALLESLNGTLFPDKFLHEQYMLITERDKIFLFSGCAHRGIVNIMERAAELCGRAPDYAFSGFHLDAPGSVQESDELIQAIGRRLLAYGTTFYTGHCTGLKPYELLKGIMGDRLCYMPTGKVIEI